MREIKQLNQEKMSNIYAKLQLDHRMVAFKHDLIKYRFLYCDIIDSRKVCASNRYDLQQAIIDYLSEFRDIYPNYTFNWQEIDGGLLKSAMLSHHEYYFILGDEFAISLTEDANIERIIEDLAKVIKNAEFRSAIGYFSNNFELWAPDDEFKLLDAHFKDKTNPNTVIDTKPTQDQIEAYYYKNNSHVRKIELKSGLINS